MKKTIIFIFVILLAIGVLTQTTKAFNLSNFFSNISMRLHSLKSLLLADIESSSEKSVSPIDLITSDMETCAIDSDCQIVNIASEPMGCCYCLSNMDSEWIWRAINVQSQSRIEEIKKGYCGNESRCPASVDCNKNPVLPIDRIAKCDSGKCIIKEKVEETTPNPVGGGTEDINKMKSSDLTFSAIPKSTTYYYCSLPLYQCVTKTVINNTGGYISLNECQKDCTQKVDKSIEPTSDMLKCSYNSECKIVDRGCCPCTWGYNEKTKIAINLKSEKDFLASWKSYCNKTTCVIAANNCRLKVDAKCINKTCTAVWEKPVKPTVTSTMKKCAKDTDCVLAESDCCGCEKGGFDDTKVGINKSYLNTFKNSIATYCKKSSLDSCPWNYDRCKVDATVSCKNKVCVVNLASKKILPTTSKPSDVSPHDPTTTTTSTTTTITTTTTTTKIGAPVITEDQRKCTNDSQCNYVETDCCGCRYGKEFLTQLPINSKYKSTFTSTLTKYCQSNQLLPCKQVDVNNCFTPKVKCIGNLCTNTWVAPIASTSTAYKSCIADTDCIVIETACCGCEKGGDIATKIGINKKYSSTVFNTFKTNLKKYCHAINQDDCSSTDNKCGGVPKATCVKVGSVKVCKVSVDPE